MHIPLLIVGALAAAVTLGANAQDARKYDAAMRMPVAKSVNGIDWIDGQHLPLEGRMFNDVDRFYDRLPKNVTTNVNSGVRGMKNHSAGLQFRFTSDSKTLSFRWVPIIPHHAMDHMPMTGVSGIDIYRFDNGKWKYVKTGRLMGNVVTGEVIRLSWKSGTPCLVNMPLYNGIKMFELGVEKGCGVKPLPPRASGINKPVVFYGTSITHGGCCSRPGLAFVNIVGRDLDVPIVNLGFSGSGKMEFEMSEHLQAIDASCYVLDCLWNMGDAMVAERYEPFIRNLRAKRPGVPIVMAEQCDVFCGPPNGKDKIIRTLYDKLIAEGWKDLVYLPKTNMYTGDCEGTVDGCHPNDWGMMSMAKAFGGAVSTALKLNK